MRHLSATFAATVVLCAPGVAANQPSLTKTYTTADGLASNAVRWIVPGFRGFVWFCTQEGLSRFDGARFRTFGREHGLPDVDIYDALETRRGDFWVAAGTAVCRLKPSTRSGKGTFEAYRPQGEKSPPVMTSLREDPDGSIWCGSDAGLFRLAETGGRWRMDRVDFGAPTGTSAQSEINALLRDWQGNLWIAAFSGLYRRDTAGRVDRFAREQGLPDPHATSLVMDKTGTLWVGTGRGLCRLKKDPRPGEPAVERVYSTRDGLPSSYVRALLHPTDGSLWVGTLSGLVRTDWIRLPGSNVELVARSDAAALAEDRAGNVWVAGAEGAARFSRPRFHSFGEANGLESSNVISIFGGQNGETYAVTLARGRQVIHRFDGQRFRASAVRLMDGEHLLSRTSGQVATLSRTGEWWFLNGASVLRFGPAPFDRLPLTAPQNSFGDATGRGSAFRVFEDSKGGVWMSYSSWTRHGLQRWDRATGRIQSFSEEDGLPPMGINLAWAFAESGEGEVWVGMSQNGLARYRNGRFQHFGAAAGRVRALHFDRAGRLWAAWGSQGVVRVDNPGAAEPHFRRVYSRENGLSGDIVHTISEDRKGRIHLGLSGGFDRIDPGARETGGRVVDHFSEADGLASGKVQAAFEDRSGAMWFGTPYGVSRFAPESGPEQGPAAPVFITGLRTGTQTLPVAELGEQRVSGLQFQQDQRQLEVEFVAPRYASGEGPRYQSKLEGADPDWGVPSNRNSVNYANLAPGSYRFLVRALTPSGRAGEVASVAFEVLPPVWMRWWFLLSAGAAVAAGAAVVHRYRVHRAVEMERVRVGIATDLHDDIGSGLSQLAILSDMLRRRLDRTTPSAIEPLTRMGAISRELVDSMEDIVWSINPARDRIEDLSRRMRQFAGEVLESQGIDFELRDADAGGDTALDPNTRRQVYLVFKEAIHNLRHSGCSKCTVDVHVSADVLVLEVQDNGRGLSSGGGEGHGLTSMRQRAERLGGTLEIDSTEKGTIIRATVPIRRTFLRTKVGAGSGGIS